MDIIELYPELVPTDTGLISSFAGKHLRAAGHQAQRMRQIKRVAGFKLRPSFVTDVRTAWSRAPTADHRALIFHKQSIGFDNH